MHLLVGAQRREQEVLHPSVVGAAHLEEGAQQRARALRHAGHQTHHVLPLHAEQREGEGFQERRVNHLAQPFQLRVHLERDQVVVGDAERVSQAHHLLRRRVLLALLDLGQVAHRDAGGLRDGRQRLAALLPELPQLDAQDEAESVGHGEDEGGKRKGEGGRGESSMKRASGEWQKVHVVRQRGGK